MEIEREQVIHDEKENQVDLDDEFQSLTDGEENKKGQDGADDIGEEDFAIDNDAALEVMIGDAEKKTDRPRRCYVRKRKSVEKRVTKGNKD